MTDTPEQIAQQYRDVTEELAKHPELSDTVVVMSPETYTILSSIDDDELRASIQRVGYGIAQLFARTALNDLVIKPLLDRVLDRVFDGSHIEQRIAAIEYDAGDAGEESSMFADPLSFGKTSPHILEESSMFAARPYKERQFFKPRGTLTYRDPLRRPPVPDRRMKYTASFRYYTYGPFKNLSQRAGRVSAKRRQKLARRVTRKFRK